MFKTMGSMSTQYDLEYQFISELLIARADRQLKEASADFGESFVSRDRPHIEALVEALHQAIATQNEAAIATTQFALNQALGNLNQRTTQRHQEEEAYWIETYWEGHI